MSKPSAAAFATRVSLRSRSISGSLAARHIAERCSLGEHGINNPQKLVGGRKDCFFERKPILGSFLVVVSETVIELDDPDGHIPDHPPGMTVTQHRHAMRPPRLAESG